MLIHLGADHAGFEMKELLKQYLSAKGFEIRDHGTYSADSVDYPDFAHPTATAVAAEADGMGILLCGSANGVAITANKHAGIRAALCWTPEVAQLARQHNNANILCIPARFVSPDAAKEMADVFLSTSFEGGRHQTRVSKISASPPPLLP